MAGGRLCHRFQSRPEFWRTTGHKIGHSGFWRGGTEAANSIKTKEKYGGRDRDRTGDPLLAKQAGQNTKCFVWCRLHGKLTKFSLSQMSRSCTELFPTFQPEKYAIVCLHLAVHFYENFRLIVPQYTEALIWWT